MLIIVLNTSAICDQTFYRSAENWIIFPGVLTDISVGGSEVWGVNSAHLIYRKIGSGNWVNIGGRLKQVK